VSRLPLEAHSLTESIAQLSPQNLKPAVTKALNELLAPIQEAYKVSPEFQEVDKLAYPPPVPEKKVKKVKDKGSRHPGAAKVEAKPDGSVEGPGKDQVNVGTSAKEALNELAEEKKAVS
jgi:tyrosyl-tRNA synthetase